MRSTAAFGRLEKFHLEPELDVGRAVQRPDAARPLFEKRTEPATPTEVLFGEISFLAAPTVIETSPATAAANPTSLKVTARRPLTVTEVTFPLLLNDHERPSPDGATQGSSVSSAAT